MSAGMWLARHSIAVAIMAITVSSVSTAVIVKGEKKGAVKGFPKNFLVAPKIQPLFIPSILNHNQNSGIISNPSHDHRLTVNDHRLPLFKLFKIQIGSDVNRLMEMQQHVTPSEISSVQGSGQQLIDYPALEKLGNKQQNVVQTGPTILVPSLKKSSSLPKLTIKFKNCSKEASKSSNEKCKPKSSDEKQINSCPEGQSFGSDQNCTASAIQQLQEDWAKKI